MAKQSPEQREVMAAYQAFLGVLNRGPFAPLFEKNIMFRMCSTPELFWQWCATTDEGRVGIPPQEAAARAWKYLYEFRVTLHRAERAYVRQKWDSGEIIKKPSEEEHKQQLNEELNNLLEQKEFRMEVGGIFEDFEQQVIADNDKARRSKGGKRTKKLTEEKHRKWLIEQLENFKGQKAIYKKIEGALESKYGYKVSARTIRDRVKELGLLESA